MPEIVTFAPRIGTGQIPEREGKKQDKLEAMASDPALRSPFLTTFLGHQGWMFRSAQHCILVDPLLREEFGHAHALEYRVWPPRNLKPAAFPRLDAVLLTHEHDDHFDIPSLAQLDRRIPIYLSARSSTAGRAILEEMGFSVRPLVSGAPHLFGDLEFFPFCGDHVNTNTGDEWDTLPFLLRHTAGAGSFFSTVDVRLTQAHIDAARGRAPQPGLVGWTNNTQDWSHIATFQPDRGDATAPFTERMLGGYAQLCERWGAPRAMLICAGGFSFYGSRAWLNKRVFCVDTDAACKMLAAVHPQLGFFAARPGQTFHMEDNRLTQVDKQTPFLGTVPGWPSRAKVPMPAGSLPDYAPATGRRELAEGDAERLREGLAEFAGALLGSGVFRSLYSLPQAETGGCAPTFAFVLRSGDNRRALVFEYNPSACTFDRVETEDPYVAYLAGLECWGTDLLAVLRAELGPIALSFGRCLLWNVAPQRFNFNIFYELCRVSHPLRRPAEFLRLYQHQWQRCAATAPQFFFRE